MSLVAGLAAYRPYFAAVAVTFLSISWTLTLSRKLRLARSADPPSPRIKWVGRREAWLLVTTSVAVVILLFPLYIGVLLGLIS